MWWFYYLCGAYFLEVLHCGAYLRGAYNRILRYHACQKMFLPEIKQKYVDYNLHHWVTLTCLISVQLLIIRTSTFIIFGEITNYNSNNRVGWEFSPKINKRGGSNKAWRWEKFLKNNKICLMLIREVRVSMLV